MKQITVQLGRDGFIKYNILEEKLTQLKTRGLMDAGLVIVDDNGLLVGYLAEGDLENGLHTFDSRLDVTARVRILRSDSGDGTIESSTATMTNETSDVETGADTARIDNSGEGLLDLSVFVDRTPLTICADSPMEYAVEMFGKLGLRYIVVTEQGSAKVVGVIIKKRLVSWLDALKHGSQ